MYSVPSPTIIASETSVKILIGRWDKEMWGAWFRLVLESAQNDCLWLGLLKSNASQLSCSCSRLSKTSIRASNHLLKWRLFMVIWCLSWWALFWDIPCFYDPLLTAWRLRIPLRPLMRCTNCSKVLIPLKPRGLIGPANARNQSQQWARWFPCQQVAAFISASHPWRWSFLFLIATPTPRLHTRNSIFPFLCLPFV